MKSFLTYAAAGFALLSPFAADAADLAVKAPPATPAAAVYNWTGMYIGVNGGYGWGKHDPLDLIAGGFDPGRSFNTSGGFIGGTIGAQIQQGYVVMGAEADLDWANITGSGTVIPTIAGVPQPFTINLSTKTQGIGTARIRAGAALNNLLIYATGGVALLDETAKGTTVNGVPCGALGVLTSCPASHWRPGAAVGLGAEYGFTPNWTMKGEYLYISAIGNGAAKNETNLLRFGVNYKF
ncbi:MULTISPECIES: outer membrane protein [unclassified Bradyrhizobium]